MNEEQRVAIALAREFFLGGAEIMEAIFRGLDDDGRIDMFEGFAIGTATSQFGARIIPLIQEVRDAKINPREVGSVLRLMYEKLDEPSTFGF